MTLPSATVVAQAFRPAHNEAALKGCATTTHDAEAASKGCATTALLLGAACLALELSAACSRTGDAPRPRHVLLITIDTLRADRVGAYGYARARTPRLDALAHSGALFTHAYAAAPITLSSHATILSGRYPPHHGARDNGIRMSASTPTLATVLAAQGFRTGAFVAAFPLDHQFGLERGFSVYSDRLPRNAMGRQANERPASEVVSEAIDWLQHQTSGTEHPAPDTEHPAPSAARPALGTQAAAPFLLWIHCFEPHAPYEGDLSRPVAERYDQEIATVDREIGRLLDALGPSLADTLIVVTGDHGEAFGEHGEYAHSLFVYDTTLRVPLIVSGPGIAPRRVDDPVTLADLAPTIARRLGVTLPDADGIDLSPALAGRPLHSRELYAESFAPLVEFGWAPLRSVRSGAWKYTAAPKPELFDLAHDADEQQSVVAAHADVAQSLDGRVNRFSDDSLSGAPGASGEAAARLRALGYLSGSSAIRNPQSAIPNPARPDPKDRRELAARIAQVTSGELMGDALLAALEGIVRDDPGNGQARLRLGYARVQAGDCGRAVPEFEAALTAGLRTTDVYLGLAGCLGQRRDLAGAERALNEARRLEPDNPVVIANIGILKASKGDAAGAIEALQSALAADPNLHEARFNLALTYARLGRRTESAAAARELLARLPPNAPQRPEVERLLKAIEAR